jgi:hypothetical protein
MTIKQQGGIFGRNPTFNDVNVEGSITVPNDSITGNAIQGGTLTVDVLGVGTTSPDSALEISSSSANEPIVKIATAHPSGTNGRLEFETNWSGNIAVKASVEGSSENATNGNLVFKTQQSGSLTEAARFNPSGNLVFPSGKGIDFSATSGTGTSELLDDYEEGTWTPIAGGSTSQSGQTYGVRGGRYTKIGRTVFVTFDVELTVEGTITGDAVVSGLPFAVPNVGDLSNGMGSLSLVLNTGASYTWQGAAPQNNSSYFNIFVKTAAATSTSSPLGSTFFANGTRIAGGGFYTV